MEVIILLAVVYGGILYGLATYCTNQWILAALTFLYARSYYDGSENTGKRRWDGFRYVVATVSQAVARACFQYRVSFDTEESTRRVMGSLPPTTSLNINNMRDANEKKKPLIFSAQPHGLFALASYFNVIQTTPEWCTSVRPFVHRHVFALPVVREVTLWLGAMDVTEANIRAALANGESVYVVLDGARAMLQHAEGDSSSQPQDDKRHEGLLKLAYELDILVCPIVHRGHDKVFRDCTPRELKPMRAFFMDLISYPFPTFWTMRCAPLSSQLLDPISPTKNDTVSVINANTNTNTNTSPVDDFIDRYYCSVKRAQALDSIETTGCDEKKSQ